MSSRLTTPPPIDLAQLEAKILGRQAGMHWYTLIIEPQSWRRVAERAGEMGYATYCPMSRMLAPPRKEGARSTACRPSDVVRPLMPGYLFLDMPGSRRRFDMFQAPMEGEEGVPGCRGYITIDRSPVALHEAVIEDMRVREKNGDFDLTGKTDSGRGFVAKWVKRGVKVEFIGGPFAMYFGMIEAVLSSKLIKVAVTILGAEVPIETPLDYIRWAG